jgi:mRNA interferase MazF
LGLKRGEIWTVSGGKDYAGKPKLAAIVNDEASGSTASVTVCSFTFDRDEVSPLCLLVEPSPENGLREPSRVMVDKITSIRKSKMGKRIGRLGEEDVARLDRALIVYLGLATSPRARGAA